MGGVDTASRWRAETDAGEARRVVVIVGESADGPACRVEAPGQLLRVWSLLQATHEQLAAALSEEDVPRLQRQLQAIRRELEKAVSPALVAELRRIAPPRNESPTTAGLRIECAVLTSWAGNVTMQMLSTLEAVSKRLPRQREPSPASSR